MSLVGLVTRFVASIAAFPAGLALLAQAPERSERPYPFRAAALREPAHRQTAGTTSAFARELNGVGRIVGSFTQTSAMNATTDIALSSLVDRTRAVCESPFPV